MSYSNGIMMTYEHAAQAIDTAGQSAKKMAGPKGATGRLVSITAVNTTAVTVASANVTLRDTGGGNTYGNLEVPVSGAGAVANDLVIDDVSDSPSDDNRIPEDGSVELDYDGGATAGDADITVVILWDITGP